MEDLDDEQRAIIARARSRLRWIDTLAEPERSFAICGLPEAEWPRYAHWVAEAAALIRKDRTYRPGPSQHSDRSVSRG